MKKVMQELKDFLWTDFKSYLINSEFGVQSSFIIDKMS